MIEKKDEEQLNQDLQIRLADYLFQVEVGQRLPSIRKLAEITQMSIGSVSRALNDMEAKGVISIQRRGHLGSQVVNLSVGALWNLVERGPLVIGMTLPMHSHFEGLATGLKRTFEAAGIETYFIFIRGSRTRLKAVKDKRCHFAVMSGLAAEKLCKRENEIYFTFPPGTWVSGYSIFYRRDAMEKRTTWQVAVDADSYDHLALTEMEFANQPIEMRYTSYFQFPRLLKSGEVDAVLWTSDQKESFDNDMIVYRPLSKEVMEVAGEKSISATLIGLKGVHSVSSVIRSCIKSDVVIEVQNKVVAGEMIPEY